MSQFRTYNLRRKGADYVWQFQYDLNGFLTSFKVLDGSLTQNHIDWLEHRFPYRIETLDEWFGDIKVRAAFQITLAEPDLSFDALWELYDHKVKRQEAMKVFGKLNQADIVKCFMTVPGYKKYVARKKIAQAMLPTFLNQGYYNDDWDKAK